MPYRSLVIALPCHSLEDFPTHYEGDEAQGLLAAWCTPWHPTLIANAGRTPTWRNIHTWDDAYRESLVVVPSVCQADLAPDFWELAAAKQTVAVRDQTDLAALTAAALGPLAAEQTGAVSDDLVADFRALGYWYLQVQLLTRQMRYASNLDEQQFQEQLLQAALAATAADEPRSRDHLTRCFGLLSEERDHYYPVEAFVLDLVVTSPETCDERLLAELQTDGACNVMLQGDTLEHLAKEQPAVLELLRAGVDAKRVTLVGGEQDSLPLPLLSCEALLQELRRGQATFERLLGVRPEVFGRRRFGMSPFLPQVLRRLGYRGVIHATLDDGRFPESSQARTQWQGVDGSTIDALCSIPLDASRPETFLKLAVRMGESMELDYVATVCLAHWPGGASPWLEFLRRGAKFGLALGQFSTLDRFFDHTSYTGHMDQHPPDRYRAPYLRQAVAAGRQNVISRHAHWWRDQVRAQAARNLAHWNAILMPVPDAANAPATLPSLPADDPTGAPAASTAGATGGTDEGESPWNVACRQQAWQLASVLGCNVQTEHAQTDHTQTDHDPPQTRSADEGTLLINPWSTACRVRCDATPQLQANHPDGPVFAVTDTMEPPQATVDVPANGFLWLSDVNTDGRGKRRRQRARPVSGETTLQNEFMEVHIDPATGGLRSLFDYQTRGNRLSQQLVYCPPAPVATRQRPPVNYSRMLADSLQVTTDDLACGEILSHGRLVDPDETTVATFRQAFRLWRGSRVLRVQLELTPEVVLEGDPWTTYFASRVAWADESNALYRDLHGTRQAATAKRFEAPSYVEIEAAAQRTFLLTGGLAYQRRVTQRMLDTLLVVAGEGTRHFEWGIGVDLRQPLVDGYTHFVPIPTLRVPPPRTPTGWLFHIDARQVVATAWEPWVDGDQGQAGFYVRLLETAGRTAPVTLSAARPLKSAIRVDFLGQNDGTCQVEDGSVRLDLGPHEWAMVRVAW